VGDCGGCPRRRSSAMTSICFKLRSRTGFVNTLGEGVSFQKLKGARKWNSLVNASLVILLLILLQSVTSDSNNKVLPSKRAQLTHHLQTTEEIRNMVSIYPLFKILHETNLHSGILHAGNNRSTSCSMR
jgi:hypothetical protein